MCRSYAPEVRLQIRERQGASRRYFRGNVNPMGPAASALPLTPSTEELELDEALGTFTNAGIRPIERGSPRSSQHVMP